MVAETEHDQLTKQARLHLSPPEVVFEELKKQAQWSRSKWFSSSWRGKLRGSRREIIRD
jgi:hypothetical protein